MLSYLAEESVLVLMQVWLESEAPQAHQGGAFIFPISHAASLCESDSFILMLAPQGSKIVAGSNQCCILYYSGHKKGEVCCSRKSYEVCFIAQPEALYLPQTNYMVMLNNEIKTLYVLS